MSDLSRWFEDELLPAVFDRLDTVFPEFGWVKDGAKGWKATKNAVPGVRPDRIVCRLPRGFFIHGEGDRQWLAYLNDGTFPRGEEWLKAVRHLAQAVGIALPERNLSPEAKARMENRKKERDLVEELVKLCHRLLMDAPEAEEARKHLAERGLAPDRWELWGLGFMPEDFPHLVEWSKAMGWSWEEAKGILTAAGIIVDKNREGETIKPRLHLHGRLVAPWRGAGEAILGWWGRKLPGGHPEAPKYLYTPGTWRTRPYLLERSGKGERLVVVEGLLDAIQAREAGVPAVALGGLGLMDPYLQALRGASPRGIILALDPDESGVKGIPAAVEKVLGAGFPAFVAELPAGGEKMDPDLFIRTHGPEAFARLVNEARHALNWKARNLLDLHRGSGWTSQTQEDVRREAVAFAGNLPAALHPALTSEYWPELAEEIPISPETLHEAALAIHEEAERERREKTTRALVHDTAKGLESLLQEGKAQDAHKLLLDQAAAIQAQAAATPRSIPRLAVDEMEALKARLDGLRGKERMGLTQDVLPKLDEALLGLRGLNLVAGPPGTGKTSLAVQLGLGVLQGDPEAAVVLLTLEQSRWEHLSRNLAYLSDLDWKTVTMGSHECRNGRDRQAGTFFTPDDLVALQKGEAALRRIGPRFLILDDDNFPAPTAEKVLREVAGIKEKTGASKVLLIVDYLQLWPIPLEVSKALGGSDLDRDKWQIGELKKLKNLMGPEDAVVAISEAKKEDWKASLGMSSIMGSARGTYTPDVVMVIQPLSVEEHAPPKTKKEDLEKAGLEKLDELVEQGVALMRLRIVKGRDGVFRRGFELAFHFESLRFEETVFSSWLGSSE